MLEDVTLRRSALAYVFPENPQLTREENLQFYDRVTASGVHVGGFQVEGPELILKRTPAPARSGLEIRVGSFGRAPKLRLLIAHLVGEDPVKMSRETADLVWQAFQKVWGGKVSRPDLTEVTLEFSIPAPGGDAERFVIDKVGRVSHAALQNLGRDPEGTGFRFRAGPAIHLGDAESAPPLPGAGIDLRIERLVEPTGAQLFVQAQVQWPAINLPTEKLPPQLREQVGDTFLQVNPRAESPNHYLEQVYEYVTGNVVEFLREASS